ncbi:MAG: 23S rRNA (uracil(1939)-C(5))-methyltransferase RlmD [Lachnospiraceae bacterium]|nr:23S rRNA (uracil(1939)-C(5))-methyltransferase RlmD [Lachnospiraceae bacterium]
MKKDDIVTLKIEDFSTEGLGIGHSEGLTLFVKDTVIGDVAEVKVMKMKKTYGYARLLRILTPSPDRVEAPCPVARPCGGCQLLEMKYEAQLRFKEQKVRNNLQRIGGFTDPPMEPIIGMESRVMQNRSMSDDSACVLDSRGESGQGMDHPFRYRNKAQFPISRDKNGKLIAGFYAGRTHTVIDCRDCLLGAKVNQTILDIVLNHMEKYHIQPYDEVTGRGLVRHVMIRVSSEALCEENASGQIMVCVVINGASLPESGRLVQDLCAIPGMTSITLNINRERTNVIMGRQIKLLWGQEFIEDTIGGIRFRISPLSFYQVNPRQTEKLYGKTLEYADLTGQETVWDLYCGIGTISLFLAQKARAVYGVEIVPDAIRDARQNAQLNHITNAEFFVGKAEEVLPEKYEKEGIHADVIVVDPPRKGCEQSVLDTMLKIRPERIVYVSCDSATLARDLKYLCADGYELKKVCPTEMFANSCHVETVALISWKETVADVFGQ